MYSALPNSMKFIIVFCGSHALPVLQPNNPQTISTNPNGGQCPTSVNLKFLSSSPICRSGGHSHRPFSSATNDEAFVHRSGPTHLPAWCHSSALSNLQASCQIRHLFRIFSLSNCCVVRSLFDTNTHCRLGRKAQGRPALVLLSYPVAPAWPRQVGRFA